VAAHRPIRPWSRGRRPRPAERDAEASA
jgi:hypothetical protein